MSERTETIKKMLPVMSEEELATLGFEVWHEAYSRSIATTEKEVEALVEEALNKKPT